MIFNSRTQTSRRFPGKKLFAVRKPVSSYRVVHNIIIEEGVQYGTARISMLL